ncbi:antibiotic biosynthesis monooxygenase family protein [Vulcanisaeta distributa]|uniref:Antibiotic biosynthesis monooxygenase n=1 Tax=Vulcanisaeta distributa (strain DSM 14429 / JCM 11212 / NBRC 100878 / IC-017) TaxID=572478 RepID=E1QR86_VULDI|nr:antibiotic biosynthesis monooxygenase [Vulcanisaeta distributa]ADN51776.1 Antibiotic biosynthesis monooxygenase [Vulcanisaeta distributa DSM 14429]
MISVGLYYRVKRGHEEEFERMFNEVLNFLRENVDGFINAKLYRSVDDPSEYLIYSEWRDLESFKRFIMSREYKETITYGRTILEDKPKHRIFQEIGV